MSETTQHIEIRGHVGVSKGADYAVLWREDGSIHAQSVEGESELECVLEDYFDLTRVGPNLVAVIGLTESVDDLLL